MSAECQCHAMAFVGAADHHGFDEPPRWNLVPSRFRLPARKLRTADHPAGGALRARSPQSSGDAGVPAANGPAPRCPTRSNAGNIRAFLNLGGSLLTAFPDAGSLLAGAARSSTCWPPPRSCRTRRRRSRRTCCRPRVSSSDPTSPCGTSLSPRVSAQHTDALVTPVGTTPFDVVGARGDRSTPRSRRWPTPTPPTRRCSRR